MKDRNRLVLIPCEGEPPCACGATRVIAYRDGIEDLMDNMGCELGLERLAGPLCPRCEAQRIQELPGGAPAPARPGAEEAPARRAGTASASASASASESESESESDSDSGSDSGSDSDSDASDPVPRGATREPRAASRRPPFYPPA